MSIDCVDGEYGFVEEFWMCSGFYVATPPKGSKYYIPANSLVSITPRFAPEISVRSISTETI